MVLCTHELLLPTTGKAEWEGNWDPQDRPPSLNPSPVLTLGIDPRLPWLKTWTTFPVGCESLSQQNDRDLRAKRKPAEASGDVHRAVPLKLFPVSNETRTETERNYFKTCIAK